MAKFDSKFDSEPSSAAPAPETVPATPAPEMPLTPQTDEDPEIFDLLKATDHELVKRYQPKFLARGGEHVIYEIPGRPDIVVKVESGTMQRIQQWNAEHNLPLDAMPPEILPHAQDHLRKLQERQRRLSKYFGREHVLGIKHALVKVPVTESILKALHDQPLAGAKDTRESWAIVKVQRRAPEFADPERMSVVSGYVENLDLSAQEKEMYRRLTRALVDGGESAEFTKEEFNQLIARSPLREALKLAEGDEGLRDALRDFVERTIRYCEETGEILDLAGGDNVTVFKQEGKWNYRLVDALYPGKSDMLERGRRAAEKAAKREKLNEEEHFVLLNAVNFARLINGLAERFGVAGRISIVPAEAKGKIDFLKLFKGEG